MGDNESSPGPSGGVDRPDLGGDPSAWESPPSERRVSDVRVAADVSVAEQTVQWIAIVEDLERDVADVPAIEPPAEIVERDAADTPVRETSVELALVTALPAEVEVADDPAVCALLTISLEPEWPGNVHRYEIMIDPRDGTFTGMADPSSNIPGETIRGAFSVDFTDISFTAVYPAPAYHYAWFGAGPLGRFTGTDSRGNVLHTLSGTVTKPAAVTDYRNDAAIAEDPPRNGRPEIRCRNFRSR